MPRKKRDSRARPSKAPSSPVHRRIGKKQKRIRDVWIPRLDAMLSFLEVSGLDEWEDLTARQAARLNIAQTLILETVAELAGNPIILADDPLAEMPMRMAIQRWWRLTRWAELEPLERAALTVAAMYQPTVNEGSASHDAADPH